MSQEWVMVRLSRVVHERLSALRDRLERAYQTGHRSVSTLGERDHFSLNALVSELVRAKEQHLWRARRAGARRKSSRAILDE